MYRARCKPAPQIQNTTIFKKPTGKETGPWLHPTRVWQGTLRLKFRVILLGVVTRVRWGEVSTPAVLRMKGKSQRCPPRRREAEGRREAAWGPAKRPETASFLDGLRTQLEQEHKTWRKRSTGQRSSPWAREPEALRRRAPGPGKQPLQGIVLAYCPPPPWPPQSEPRPRFHMVTFGTPVTNTSL